MSYCVALAVFSGLVSVILSMIGMFCGWFVFVCDQPLPLANAYAETLVS